MNIQTERLENHVARLTVEVEDKQWQTAKQKAARALSKRYRIPGFRKGKAPYSVILRYLGEASIVENAIENLGQEIYRDVLEQSEVDPYTSGSIEDFQLEPQPTYIFTVPLQPEVELGEHREVRLDYEAPEITDEQVNEALEQLRQREALVEESDQPVAVGNRITVDIHSEFADEAPEAEVEASDSDDDTENDSEDSDDAEEDDENAVPQKGDNFAHQHDAVLNLDPESEPLLPGFIEAMVGATVDEEREFELTVPEDDEDYADIAGRKVQFNVTVKKVEVVTLPELNDDFAAKVSSDGDEEDEAEPMTLLQLRIQTREDLQEEANRRAEDAYANQVLDAIVEQATVKFSDAMLSDRVHEMLHDFDRQLQQQGMNLETYQRVLGVTHDQLHEQYHDDAVASLNRSLVLGEVMVKENISLKEGEVEAEVEKMLAQFGEQAEVFRQYFDTPQQRSNIANSLLYDRLMARLAKIGKGETLEDEVEEETTEAVADDSVEVEASADVVEEVEASAESDEETGEADAEVEDVATDDAAASDDDEETEEAESDAATDDETESE